MTRPTIWRLVAVLLVAAMAAGDLTAQTPATSSRNRRVWTGTIDDREILLGEHDTTPIRRPVRYFQNAQVSFTFVSEDMPERPGFTRWLSRQLSWTAYGYSASSIESYECNGSGSVDLGPADVHDHTTPEQDERLRIPCTNKSAPNVWAFIKRPNPKVHLPDIDLSMTNCEPTRRWSAAGVRYTLAVAAEGHVSAVVDVERQPYEAFVPVPGRTLTVSARSTSGPVRFRFELDGEGTSRFPGYATNANVDDVFLVKNGLTHLRGQYTNDDPDVIFDPRQFGAERWGGGSDLWSRVEPTVVETRTLDTAAMVTVTAMDYGASGRLRAFAQSADCGGSWQPVPIRIDGQSHDSVAIPFDEDNNLMADALEPYRGLAAGDDADAEPTGNGMAGDGLTNFEEYRGFLVRGAGCGSEATEAVYQEIHLGNGSQFAGWSDEHTRTSPTRKDLFVHTPDPELALLVPAFATASDLAVHVICEPHYVDNDTRVVNFTLHHPPRHAWRGHRIAREQPQHGVRLEPVDLLGLRGIAIPVTDGYLGPPALTRTVQILKPGPDSSGNALRGRLELGELVHTIVHELSHAVGVPHHGDRVEASTWRLTYGRQNITTRLSLQLHAGGPPDSTQPDSLPEMPDAYYAAVDGRQYLNALLIEPGPDCVEGAPHAVFYRDGKFAGCEASSIARRGEQNSGHFECPMRYSGSDYYEAPGTTAQYRWTGLVSARIFGRLEPGTLVDAWGGKFLKYRNDLDRDGNGRFCTRVDGTEINSLPGDLNHAGAAGRDKPCTEFLVVNDMAGSGGSR